MEQRLTERRPVRIFQAGKGFLLTFTNLGPDVDNPVEGRSVAIRTGGSVSSTKLNPDGTQTVTATGHNALILFPTDVGGPDITLYIGRLVYTVSARGVFEVVSASGSQRDVCSELAG